jgi:hypothetical protein
MGEDIEERRSKWCNHPIIITAGIIVIYTVSHLIMALLICKYL